MNSDKFEAERGYGPNNTPKEKINSAWIEARARTAKAEGLDLMEKAMEKFIEAKRIAAVAEYRAPFEKVVAECAHYKLSEEEKIRLAHEAGILAEKNAFKKEEIDKVGGYETLIEQAKWKKNESSFRPQLDEYRFMTRQARAKRGWLSK